MLVDDDLIEKRKIRAKIKETVTNMIKVVEEWVEKVKNNKKELWRKKKKCKIMKY